MNLLTCGKALEILSSRKASYLLIYDRIDRSFEGIVTFSSLLSVLHNTWKEVTEGNTSRLDGSSSNNMKGSAFVQPNNIPRTNLIPAIPMWIFGAAIDIVKKGARNKHKRQKLNLQFQGHEWFLDINTATVLAQVQVAFSRKTVRGMALEWEANIVNQTLVPDQSIFNAFIALTASNCASHAALLVRTIHEKKSVLGMIDGRCC